MNTNKLLRRVEVDDKHNCKALSFARRGADGNRAHSPFAVAVAASPARRPGRWRPCLPSKFKAMAPQQAPVHKLALSICFALPAPRRAHAGRADSDSPGPGRLSVWCLWSAPSLLLTWFPLPGAHRHFVLSSATAPDVVVCTQRSNGEKSSNLYLFLHPKAPNRALYVAENAARPRYRPCTQLNLAFATIAIHSSRQGTARALVFASSCCTCATSSSEDD